jgi:hypothetical protein
MTDAKIFLINSGETTLKPMVETAFEKEDILQVLIEKYPELIPGDQINPDNPRRWLLVKREMGIPKEELGNDHWSLDHLLLDQDGIPTFVECKRSTDTRSRREVVAQMLDYAANGTTYWGMDRLRQAAAETAQIQGRSLDEEIIRLIESEKETDVEEYWGKVETNLKKGTVRLLFVTDNTPRELRRLVEFLNSKMDDVEILAVEIKQFLGSEGRKAVVPRVIGQTEIARETKTGGSGGKRMSSLDEFITQCDPIAGQFFDDVISTAKKKGYIVYLGMKGISLRAKMHDGRIYSFIYCMPLDSFEFYFGMPLSKEKETDIREKLQSFGVFRMAGDKTLKAKVTKENLETVKKAYVDILEIVDEILASK